MTRKRSAEESSENGTQRRPPEKLNFRGPRDPALHNARLQYNTYGTVLCRYRITVLVYSKMRDSRFLGSYTVPTPT